MVAGGFLQSFTELYINGGWNRISTSPNGFPVQDRIGAVALTLNNVVYLTGEQLVKTRLVDS